MSYLTPTISSFELGPKSGSMLPSARKDVTFQKSNTEIVETAFLQASRREFET